MQTKQLFGALALAFAGTALQAQVAEVSEAWVRASVPGQAGTAAFMKIKSRDGAVLVSGSSTGAGVVEVHEMKMDAGVMRMRAVAGGLSVPAGQTVELKPGGYHVMLMDLKAALPVNSKLPLTLVFKDAKGQLNPVEVSVPVYASAPGPAKPNEHKH